MDKTERLKDESVKYKVDRANAVREMMSSVGFKDFLQPELEKKITEVTDIKKIDEKNVEKSYMKNKLKYDIYSGILNMLKNWVAVGDRLNPNKEEKNGRPKR